MSGVVCNLQIGAYIAQRYICDSDGDCFNVIDLMRAVEVSGGRAGTHGDSGGPVFSLDGDGVRAKGVVHGGDEAS